MWFTADGKIHSLDGIAEWTCNLLVVYLRLFEERSRARRRKMGEIETGRRERGQTKRGRCQLTECLEAHCRHVSKTRLWIIEKGQWERQRDRKMGRDREQTENRREKPYFPLGVYLSGSTHPIKFLLTVCSTKPTSSPRSTWTHVGLLSLTLPTLAGLFPLQQWHLCWIVHEFVNVEAKKIKVNRSFFIYKTAIKSFLHGYESLWV